MGYLANHEASHMWPTLTSLGMICTVCGLSFMHGCSDELALHDDHSC